uniref:Uncharacterized protein n=1 Tax=Haptolina ericina TaxID=156174 RepID=A0A7S3EUT8_9EUKA|mmetsp:Transcript_22057/g.49799  ORF Transcript_22057/g.49799 Transcript_22057/m.49799 type:complete len:130 (+) Transcript_22057:219-608(+)
MDVHSRAGIKHFYITGHSLGGAVGLLAASQMSPPLPALVFAPGGWRTALLNCTRGRAVGGSALSGYGNSTLPQMPQLVSVLSSWDPVSANAFSAGELHGQVLEYDYISPDYEDVCHSCFSFSAYSECAS